MKKIPMLLAILGLISLSVFIPGYAHAQTDAYSASITVDGSSDILVNGQATSEDYVANGDTVNVSFYNNAGGNILLCSKGSSPQSIGGGGSADIPVTVNGEAEIEIDLSSGNCDNGSGNPGYLYIEGATGSLSCSTTNNQVWNITGQYSYVAQSMYLYKGSTYVEDVQASNGGGGYYFNASFNIQFAAQTSAATYYLHDGPSSSAELIGQAICSAIKTVTAAPPATSTTTPGSSSTSTTTPATTPVATPVVSTPKQTTNTQTKAVTKPTKKNPTKKVASDNTGLYISGGVVIALVAGLIILNLTDIWTVPKKLFLRIRHSKKTSK